VQKRYLHISEKLSLSLSLALHLYLLAQSQQVISYSNWKKCSPTSLSRVVVELKSTWRVSAKNPATRQPVKEAKGAHFSRASTGSPTEIPWTMARRMWRTNKQKGLAASICGNFGTLCEFFQKYEFFSDCSKS